MSEDQLATGSPYDRRNWGRWGAEDRSGAQNRLSSERTLDAVALVKQGVVIELGSALVPGRRLLGGRIPTLRHAHDVAGTTASLEGDSPTAFCEDYVFASTHSASHIDALSHCVYDGLLYNGIAAPEASTLSVTNIKPFVTRGLLCDLEGSREQPLEPGEEIGSEELEALLGGPPREGDVVLLRTAWQRHWDRDPRQFLRAQPGIGIEAARWLEECGVVAVGADNGAIEAFGGGVAQDNQPVHRFLLRDCGVYLMELLDLDELARELSGKHPSFLFVAAPVKIVDGTAGLINPVAVL